MTPEALRNVGGSAGVPSSSSSLNMNPSAIGLPSVSGWDRTARPSLPPRPPHGLRKRRGSLLSKQGYSLAEISERLGDTKVVTAEHYLYALGDYTEADYAAALAR